MAKVKAQESESPMRAKVHRFRDTVAVYLKDPDGRNKTVYLSSHLAKALAEALQHASEDIEYAHFSMSLFKGREYDAVGKQCRPPLEANG